MQRFSPLNQLLLGNPVERWLVALAIALAVGALLCVAKVVVGRRVTALAERSQTKLDDLAADLIGRTRFYFIVALALRAGSVALALGDNVSGGVRKVTAIAVLLQIAVWGGSVIDFWIRQWEAGRGTGASSSTTINAIGVMARGGMWTLIALLALRNVLDYDITAAITTLGVGGIAIALAVQNVLGDLFAALSIVLDKPFDVGDAISVDELSGTVEHIGLKTTRVRATGGEQVIFSNADLLRSRVRNHRRMTSRRAQFNVAVTYETPPEAAARIPGMIREIVEATPSAVFERAHFARYGPTALEFEVVYHIPKPDYALFMDTQQAVNLELLRRFGAEGIEFAVTGQTVVRLDAGTGNREALKSGNG